MECPEVRHKYKDYPDICNLNDRICEREIGNECEIYNEWLKEIEDDTESEG